MLDIQVNMKWFPEENDHQTNRKDSKNKKKMTRRKCLPRQKCLNGKPTRETK